MEARPTEVTHGSERAPAAAIASGKCGVDS